MYLPGKEIAGIEYACAKSWQQNRVCEMVSTCFGREHGIWKAQGDKLK